MKTGGRASALPGPGVAPLILTSAGSIIITSPALPLLATAGQFHLALSAAASGGVPEWLKGTDCKSVGFAYVGSNPTPSTSDCPGFAGPGRRGNCCFCLQAHEISARMEPLFGYGVCS